MIAYLDHFQPIFNFGRKKRKAASKWRLFSDTLDLDHNWGKLAILSLFSQPILS